MEYLRLDEEFHHGFRALAKSRQLDRALEHTLALPFAPPSALLMVTRRYPSRGRSCSWRSTNTTRSSTRSAGVRERARTRSRESTRASHAGTSTSRSRTESSSTAPGSTLLRLPAA